jgi:hypothetical protein
MLPLSREPDIIIPNFTPISVETKQENLNKKQNENLNKMRDLLVISVKNSRIYLSVKN